MDKPPGYNPFGLALAAGGDAGDFNGEVISVLNRWRDRRAIACERGNRDIRGIVRSQGFTWLSPSFHTW
jgi:hypothetical protein